MKEGLKSYCLTVFVDEKVRTSVAKSSHVARTSLLYLALSCLNKSKEAREGGARWKRSYEICILPKKLASSGVKYLSRTMEWVLRDAQKKRITQV